VRLHLLGFYAFARFVDELGDAYEGNRLAALDEVENQTRAVLNDPGREDALPIVATAARSVLELDADQSLLFDLIAANRQDQTISRYDSFDDLLAYCALSANPVGRLVLAAFRASSEALFAWSDSICTGLQLAEHWQDVAEDAAAGRVYLPREDLIRFGVESAALSAGPPASPAVRALLVFEVARARGYLDRGQPLIGALDGSARWAVAGFWAGGHAALDGIAQHGFDVLAGTPHRSRLRTMTRAMTVVIAARRAQPVEMVA
jgi:squalene synthase HpnC